jgi:hypothetical protein
LSQPLADKQAEIGVKATVAEADANLKKEQAGKVRAEAQAIHADLIVKALGASEPAPVA